MQEVTVRLYYREIEWSVRETQAARDELLKRKGVEKAEGEITQQNRINRK